MTYGTFKPVLIFHRSCGSTIYIPRDKIEIIEEEAGIVKVNGYQVKESIEQVLKIYGELDG